MRRRREDQEAGGGGMQKWGLGPKMGGLGQEHAVAQVRPRLGRKGNGNGDNDDSLPTPYKNLSFTSTTTK